jgi:hypothetical protein
MQRYNPTKEPVTLQSEKLIEDPITFTATKLEIPTGTNTNTSITEFTQTPTFLPPPGEYIAYSKGKFIQLVTITDQEVGTIISGANEGRNWLSPNQEIIAYSDQLHKIDFKNIYTREDNQIHDNDMCTFGVTNMSWNPEGNKIVLGCAYTTDIEGQYFRDLKVLSYPEGKVLGRINKVINYNDIEVNHPIQPTWSTDGKWIIFFISTGMRMGIQGPFVTNTSCLSDDQTCPSKTTLKAGINNVDFPISWLPNSNLAVLDYYNNNLILYNLPYFTLMKTIKIPELSIGLHSLAWSHNDEWFALGTDDGIFIISSFTGEVKQVSEATGRVLFWLEIK